MTKKEVLTLEKTMNPAEVGQHIGFELGAKMIKDFRDAHGDDNMRFVGRNIIENILSQPGCVGVSIYDAIEEDGRKTFVIVGIGQDGLPILEYQSVNKAGDIEKKEGIVADKGLGWIQFGLDQGF